MSQVQFHATGTYSNLTTQDLTTLATWTSSDPTVATINASGLASLVTIAPSESSAIGGGTASVDNATYFSLGVNYDKITSVYWGPLNLASASSHAAMTGAFAAQSSYWVQDPTVMFVRIASAEQSATPDYNSTFFSYQDSFPVYIIWNSGSVKFHDLKVTT